MKAVKEALAAMLIVMAWMATISPASASESPQGFCWDESDSRDECHIHAAKPTIEEESNEAPVQLACNVWTSEYGDTCYPFYGNEDVAPEDVAGYFWADDAGELTVPQLALVDDLRANCWTDWEHPCYLFK